MTCTSLDHGKVVYILINIGPKTVGGVADTTYPSEMCAQQSLHIRAV